MRKWIIFCLFSVTLFADAAQAEELAPETVDGAQTIQTETARLFFERDYIFVDVRGRDDFLAGHIPNAHHLPLRGDFSQQNLLRLVDKDQPVIFYCNGVRCLGSSIASQQAVGWGWTKVLYYREGLPGWIEQGWPVNSVR